MPMTRYAIVVTRTRFGYESNVERTPDFSRFGCGQTMSLNEPWWRLTARGARRVAARWVRRQERAETWRQTVGRYEL